MLQGIKLLPPVEKMQKLISCLKDFRLYVITIVKAVKNEL
jgi:hypothetical protein